MVEHVSFQVHGDFLTDYFRQKFWDENTGFKNVVKLIQNSLCEQFSEQMCIELLEGRKKLEGINSFNFVEDNERIRPLSDYISKQEEKLKRHRIVKNMESYPYEYIDQYACTTSRTWMKLHYDECKSANWWYQELFYERGDYGYDILENGCSWLVDFEKAAEVISKHTDKEYLLHEEFEQVVFQYYESIIDGLRKEETPYDEMNDFEQAIIARNSHYASTNRIPDWNYLGQKGNFTTRKRQQKIDEDRRQQEEEERMTAEVMSSVSEKIDSTKSPMSSLIAGFSEIFKNDPFDTSPSKVESGWDGFIDREGRFYKTKPIGAGWYNGSANCHHEWAIQYLKEQGIDVCKDEKDYLIQTLGWCDISHFVLLSNDVNVQCPRSGLSESQINTLYDLFVANGDSLEKYAEIVEREQCRH